MTALIDAFLSRIRSTLTVMVIMVAAGIISYATIPRESDPDIPIPIIAVSVTHAGISAEDSERLIIKPLENELQSLEGIKEMNSIAAQDYGVVVLEFDIDFDKNRALADVRSRVDAARARLPDDTDEPTVNEFNIALFPVIVVTLFGDVPERTLRARARLLKDQLERLPTVLEADLLGSREEQLEIIIEPALLESYALDQRQVLEAVALNNRLVAAGSLDTGDGRFAVKVPGLIETYRDVLSLPVKVSGESVVTVADVASVRRTFKAAEGFARFNGKPAIAIEVKKRIGANVVETTANVREVTLDFTRDWPEAIQVDFTLDASTWIFRSLSNLQSSILNAVLLVMIVVVAALGLRSAMMVGIAIPASFMIGFLFLAAMGLTLNMMVMFGMLLSVGILVDGAIVVVEYADRKMAEGLPRNEAYALAAKRMFWPIIASTATTLAAFLPMLLWPGVSGKFMSFLPITLIVVLLASLVMALVFLPAIGSLLGRSEETDSDTLRLLAGDRRGDPRSLPGLTGRYIRLLARLMDYPGRVLAGAAGLLLVIVLVYSVANNGVQFFVDTEPDQASVLVSARGNLSALEVLDLTREVEDIVMTTPGVRTTFTTTGTPGASSGAGGNGQDTPPDLVSRILLELEDFSQRRRGAVILEEIRRKTAEIPGIVVEVRKREEGPPTGKDVQIELVGQSREALDQAIDMIRHHLDANVDGLVDVQDSRALPGIEWVLTVDRERAARFGADVATVGAAIQLVTNGVLAGTYRPDDSEDEIDIRIRFPETARYASRLDDLRIQTVNGQVPVGNFVERTPQPRVSTIDRVDGLRRMSIEANTAIDPLTGRKILADTKVREIRTWLQDQTLPPGVRWTFRGANEEQGDSAAFLAKAMVGALFLMFLILLTQFNSFYHATLTLSTVVLSTVGVLVGMIVTGQTFSIIMTGTGIVALAGIVVNNSIVLIDTFQRLLRDGMAVADAVLLTAGQRLRPILLTTLTTICGLMPMALQLNVDFAHRTVAVGGPVSVWWVQLATAIIFGLGFSTLLTLVLVPVLLAAPDAIRRRRSGLRPEMPAGFTASES